MNVERTLEISAVAARNVDNSIPDTRPRNMRIHVHINEICQEEWKREY